MKAPGFWYVSDAPIGKLLAPLGRLAAAAVIARRARSRPWTCPIPVICVGNATVGGAGKTPVVRSLVQILSARGLAPHILSRGYGGREAGPLRVVPERHGADQVGDEPLLLAQSAPCWIARDRRLGAEAIVAAGGRLIVMDDGYQNSALKQDLRLLVIDGETGFGNERMMPAGPLREPLDLAVGRAHALIIMGEDRLGVAARFAGQGRPAIGATLVPDAPDRARGRRLFGFAGIGRPGKFAATLRESGAQLIGFESFADHHPYGQRELERLRRRADAAGAALITTEKDWIRLPETWRRRIECLPVTLRWTDPAGLDKLLKTVSPGHG